MWIILQVLLLLSPDQKSLLAMARHGDMIAADQLVVEICALPNDEKAEAAAAVRKALKRRSSKALMLLTKGLDRCAPLGSGLAKSATNNAPHAQASPPARRGESGRALRILDIDAAEKPDQGRSTARHPISAKPDKASPDADNKSKRPIASAAKAKEEKGRALPPLEAVAPGQKQKTAVKARGGGTKAGSKKSRRVVAKNRRPAAEQIDSVDSLPDGDQDPPQQESRNALAASSTAPRQNENFAAATSRPQSLVNTAPQERIGDLDSRKVLQDALSLSSLGGGFVAVASVSYVGALLALGHGAYQHLQLVPPDPESTLVTPDGRSEQDVYDSQVIANWTNAGMLAGVAAVTATIELIIGLVLMRQGAEVLESSQGGPF